MVKRSIVGNNSNTINHSSIVLYPVLDTSRQSHNTRSSTYTDSSDTYKALIPKKIPIIRILRLLEGIKLEHDGEDFIGCTRTRRLGNIIISKKRITRIIKKRYENHYKSREKEL